MTRSYRRQRGRSTGRIRFQSHLLLLVIPAILGCERSNPAAPMCTGAIEIELAATDVHVGETFAASASHRVEQCLDNLTWSATGSVRYQFAEAESATFLAVAEGEGTITVRSRQGNLGILQLDVSPPESAALPLSPGAQGQRRLSR